MNTDKTLTLSITGDNNSAAIDSADGFERFKIAVMSKYTGYLKNKRKKSANFKFNLKDYCEKLNLNYTTAQKHWISSLRKCGFVIEKEKNDGNYIIVDYVYKQDIDAFIANASEGDLTGVQRNAVDMLHGKMLSLGITNTPIQNIKPLLISVIDTGNIDRRLVTVAKISKEWAKHIAVLLTFTAVLEKRNGDYEHWCKVIEPYSYRENKSQW